MKQDIRILPREKYQDMLRRSEGAPVIKIITGMRRCGKSALLMLFRDELISNGKGEHVYYRKFDDELESDVPDHRGLIEDVKAKVDVGPGDYIILDEIQDVEGWERAVMSFFENGADVYITGSNAHMLSSELSTKLSGRFIEIEVLPLSFREFISFRREAGDESDTAGLFERFYRNGSLPAVALLDKTQENLVDTMIMGIFNTVYVKDVLERNSIRNIALMDNLNRFLMKDIGNRVSVKNASGFLTSMGMKRQTTPQTIDNYISMLERALLFHRSKRMDAETRTFLVTTEKFYCNDLGIRNSIVGLRAEDLNGILENLVFLELKYRFGSVFTLGVGRHEVDFIVKGDKGPEYYQVCYDLNKEETFNREVTPLRSMDDNYPKTIVVWNDYPLKDIDGIRVVRIMDWLTGSD